MKKGLEDIIINPEPDFNQLKKALLRDGKPDYVPLYELYVDQPVMEALLGKKLKSRSSVEYYRKAGYDYIPVWPQYDMELGRLEDSSSRYPIENWKDFEEYSWPDPHTFDYSEFERIIPELPDGMRIVGQLGGPFEMLQMLLGFTGMCYMLYDEPDLVGEVMNKISDIYTAIYKAMASIEQVGAIVISDDMGYKKQTLIRSDDLKRLVLPLHKELAAICHKADKPCILHSCGQIYPIMDDMIDYVKIDAKHSFEDEIMPVEKASELFGKRIAILGGLDVDMLCRAGEAEIRKRTYELVTNLGKNGGYAIGSGNSIPYYVSVGNYLAMLDEAWKTRIHGIV